MAKQRDFRESKLGHDLQVHQTRWTNVKMSHSHLPNSPIGKKTHHFISNLNDSYQNGACTDVYKIALSPTQCPTLWGGGGDVTFLKLSADQLIISIDCHLIFVCRNLLCLQWLEIYCFKYQVFNRSAPLQCYYYLACFIELFSVQLHFCCPAHFYSETSLGRELNLIFAFLWSSPTTPPCCRTAPANL